MVRLFVGLRPPAEIRRLLIATMGGIPGARWQSDDQLHLTLRFIGEVAPPCGEDIAAALLHVRGRAFDVRLDGVGAFDSRGRINALWAGVRPHEGPARLHRTIDQAIVRAGLPPERRAYLPHITLARMNASAASAERFLAEHAGLASPPFRCTHFTLFQSHLSQGGARYETVARYPLD